LPDPGIPVTLRCYVERSWDFAFVPLIIADQDEATCEDLAAAIVGAAGGAPFSTTGMP
jgi:hypothetical protein